MSTLIPRVGSITYAVRASSLWQKGERGVCYEIYGIGDRAGFSFIFEKGGYDGFSEDELEPWLLITKEIAPSVVGFQFKNVLHLTGAYQAGWFDEALKITARQT